MSPDYGEEGSGDGPYGGGENSTVWSVGSYRLQYSSLTVADGRMFTAGLGPEVYAVDIPTTAVLWKFPRAGSLVDSSPAVGADRVYVGSGSGTLYAIDREDGTEVWSVSNDNAIVSSPELVSDTVYVGDNAGRVRAVDAATGRIFWSRTIEEAVLSRPVVGTDVYVTAEGGAVAALSPSGGSVEWTTRVPVRSGDFRGSPALASGVLLVGGDRLQALDVTAGDVLWTVAYGGSDDATPVVDDGTVYAGDSTGTVTAVETATGSVAWTADVGGAVPAAVAVVGGTVYAGTVDGELVALDAGTGTETGRWSLGGRVMSPTVAGAIVYVSTWDGNVFAVGRR